MDNERLLVATVLAGLLLVTVPLTAHADGEGDLKTEWLTYSGTNLRVPGLPLLGNVGPFVINAPCDQPGLGAVRFCETLDEPDPTDLPDRVAIDLRDESGMRASGIWEFRDSAGSVLRSGSFCGFVNTFVPHPGTGDPDPAALIVYPGVDTGDVTPCGSPGTTGTATVIWRYDAPVFDP